MVNPWPRKKNLLKAPSVLRLPSPVNSDALYITPPHGVRLAHKPTFPVLVFKCHLHHRIQEMARLISSLLGKLTMTLPSEATKIVLAERPKGSVDDSTFRTERVPMTSLTPSKSTEVLVRVDYVSMDPAMRGWLNNSRSYVPPVQIGETMRAGGIGTVVKVHETEGKLKIGDVVQGFFGWTNYALMDESKLTALNPPPGATALDYLGVLGNPALTAYFGLLEVGQLKSGDTCVVSGAAGAVGSVVCQIAKLKGAKVIAIAGSDDKCKWLETDLRVDKALNYKSPSFRDDFKNVGYLDVYFDNVGGEILDLCLTRLNKGARVALCGAISDYNNKPKGLTGYLNLISQRAKIEGFIVFDYVSRYEEARTELAQWLKEGKLKRRFHIEQGLENCPKHLNGLFAGVNTGKMVVQVSSMEPSRL
ncbi:hypothetical protein FS837_004049 [Tulasnella sp. UAMH 9824]|nr:hypothetical protein FS837_004049 [Tulasnella sp. UAMH 9824]